MAQKDCPSCGASVPVEAFRCKHCFHDFTEKPKKNTGPVVLLGFIAAMAVIGAGTFWWVFNNQSQERIVVDAETRSIVITKTSGAGVDSTRVSFDAIEKVEHVMGGDSAMFEVVAVTLDDKRYVVQQSDDSPLKGNAEHIASVIGKPMVEVKNVTGFGD
jgi:ribosomal protein L40E